MPRFQGIPVETEQKRGGRFGGIPVERGEPVTDAQPAPRDPLVNPLNAAVGVLAKPLMSLPGMQRGITDIVDAGAQMLVNALPHKFVSGVNEALGPKIAPTAQQFNAQQADEERAYQRSRLTGGIDLPRLGGNIIGTLPASTVLPGLGPTLASTALRSAVTGGVVGSMNPVVNDQEPFWSQKGKQVALGAATGGVVAPGIQLLARAVSPKVDTAVKYLMDRGVTPTPGQIAGKTAAKTEEVLTSVPGMGDFIKNAQRRGIESFNRAAYDEVLKPIGAVSSGEVGHAGVKGVGDKLSAAYDELVPNLQLVPDEQFMQALDDAAASKALMSDQAAKQFTAIVEKELPRGPLFGQPLKDLESKLSKEIARFARSQDPSHQMISEALGDIRGAVLDNLARVNPGYAERLASINAGWSNLVRLERAAANTKDGIFTPEGLLAAAKVADSTVRKRGIARGMGGPMQDLGKAGYEVLGRAYPDSGSPGRILTSGAVLGYVEPTALAAAAAGSAPYTELGQKLATAILAKRPQIAVPARQLIERSAIPGGAIAPLGLSGALVKPPPKRRKGN